MSEQITIYRVSCRACGKMFKGASQEEADKAHKQHVDNDCETIKVLKKVESFRKKAIKILGRELTFREATKLLDFDK